MGRRSVLSNALLLLLSIHSSRAVFNCTGKEKTPYSFPEGFLWATATSAFQVEGAAAEDGRGPSTWDTFAKIPGKIADNSTGAIACDSYHNLDADLEMLELLGVNTYRFSISWSRVFPSGFRSSLNRPGVQYYHRLIDGLLERNIAPAVTMYHWDLPQSLADLGGWLNPQVVQWFGDYARFLFSEYGSKVHLWITLNEPISNALYGYCGTMAEHAPGGFREHCKWAPYLVGHHMILAHAEAFHVYNNEFRQQQRGLVGITNTAGWVQGQTPDDEETVQRVRQMQYFWFTDPFFFGEYPPLMREQLDKLSRNEGLPTSRLPEFTPEQKQMLIGAVDFLGTNYYITTRATPLEVAYTGKNWYNFDAFAKGTTLEDAPQIPGTWISVNPEGLLKMLKTLSNRYNNTPIFITENGCMDAKGVEDDEGLEDSTRVFYLEQHVQAVAKALEANVNVIGYTVWSLMDNFEWTGGYENRFGLFHVDFSSPDRGRTPKRSVSWYRQLIRQNSIEMC